VPFFEMLGAATNKAKAESVLNAIANALLSGGLQ
jgi:hypothetical protein